MAICPFAIWKPISGSVGPYLGGPFKIVHHTTEGSSADGAMQAFAKHRSDPHFTVDGRNIYQHIDTQQSARALRNEVGGVQTNRDSAVQIELVGFAHLPKDRKSLTNLARLCRWIENQHGVPKIWPAGLPKPAKNGKDPGKHIRDPNIWDNNGGHYGHCHVPENTHWDPAYTADEVDFIMHATFDAKGKLISTPIATVAKLSKTERSVSGTRINGAKTSAKLLATAVTTMPDHDIVPTGMTAYLRDLAVQAIFPPFEGAKTPITATNKRAKGAKVRASKSVMIAGTQGTVPPISASIDGGSVISFVADLNQQDTSDVLYSVQIAQRGASGFFDRFSQTQLWYQKYIEILSNLGWASEQLAFSHYTQSQGDFQMDQAALAVIAAVAMQNQLAVLQQSIAALARVAESDGTIRLFDFHASEQDSGNFQIGAVQRLPNGALSMALGAFYFRCVDSRKRFLFLKWGAEEVNFWTAAQRMTLNTGFYAKRREAVIAKLGADANSYLADLPVGPT
ncbi:peptidoglycan recognition protein family protein [Cupriavidus consociatus]|uniref:peptidoglycan recognition protein family protein n=1 Tax=Cupriavidus consociatus TaxID=2821357 RepID=UPI001AE426E5|nr:MULTISPECIES: N-acetylmuramoyl-L-alanine amidase [unclassified Cupriavidus]MBP0624989.1 N-acetylmuramoyl-L-alanine amidase [Cupriavidus sp. LEh25]MDK2661722.1 N-acetylmuramoyl-L-alanine amidase [Cupriavidus sp. LEh21]